MAILKGFKPASLRRSAAYTAVDVAPRGDGWQVKREGAARASSVHGSKADAVSAASRMMRGAGGLLRVHAGNGRVREMVTIGRKAAAKISAVEGLELDRESKQNLVKLDRKDVSAERRRDEMMAVYGSGPKRSR